MHPARKGFLNSSLKAFYKNIKTLSSKSTGMDSPPKDTKVRSQQAVEKLKKFGYAFNSAGQLREINPVGEELSEVPFKFDVYDDHYKNQTRYEEISEQITEIVYNLLEENGLSRIYIPDHIPADEGTFFFSYPAKLHQSKKMLVLIHGSGFVRAGQWARSLIINHSLDHGSQLPYIKRAISLGYDVVVTNTNDNYRTKDGVRKAIPEVNTPNAHAAYIWKKYIIPSNPDSVSIVAHSAGGSVTLDLVNRFSKFFKEKVIAIAFTDSAHHLVLKNFLDIIGDRTCNWIASNQPLDTVISAASEHDFHQRSAGHMSHEWTSYSAIEPIFKYLQEKYENFIKVSNK